MKKFFKNITVLDFIFIALVLAFIVFFSVLTFNKSSGSSGYLKVTALNKTYLYSLNEDRIFEVPGPLGKTKIEIKDGKARILFSPCPCKTCMSRPPISEVGEWIVCLPNEVYLKIESDETTDVDEATDIIVN